MSGVSVSLVDVMGEDAARLYTVYGKLSSLQSNPALIAQEVASYQTILSSVKGSDAVKQLAADYIPQFLHFFPALVESGINAQLDLVEDDKPLIRIHAIRGLETIAKHNPTTVKQIAEVLAQLLNPPEASALELTAVKSTFSALFAIDAKAAFLALFNQAATGADVPLRKAVLEYLQSQLKSLTPTIKKNEEASAALCAGLKQMLSAAQNALIGKDELRFFVQALITFTPYGNNPAKIRADESLKNELALIALTQAGLKNANGVLDLSNEAALRHFLAVQGIVNTLSKEYGVDSTAFSQVFFQQLLPNLELIKDPELKTQVLQGIANSASKLTPKLAQSFFGTFWTVFKATLPTGVVAAPPAAPAADGSASSASAAPVAAPAPVATGPEPKINYSTAEVVLYLFHLLAPLAPAELKTATGIFTPTGQPGENIHAVSEKKEEFLNRIQVLLQANAAYKASLHAVQKTIKEQVVQGGKNISMLKQLGKPAPKAPSAASTGQPVGPEKPAAAAPAQSPEEITKQIEAQAEANKVLRSKQNSVEAAIRISANITSLAKPLLNKPLPTFLPASAMTLSFRRSKVEGGGGKSGQAGGKPAGGKPAQKGGNQKGGQQQQQQGGKGKGQKRKSAGPDQPTKSQSNKKRSAGNQGSSQQSQSNKGGNNSQKKKKQKTGNQQQQQNNGNNNQQRGSNKKQRGSNKGGRRN